MSDQHGILLGYLVGFCDRAMNLLDFRYMLTVSRIDASDYASNAGDAADDILHCRPRLINELTAQTNVIHGRFDELFDLLG